MGEFGHWPKCEADASATRFKCRELFTASGAIR